MSNRSPITLWARVLVLSLIVGALGIFNTGSTLAAKNRNAPTAGAQDSAQTGSSQLNGQLIANGAVTINGNRAITGTTIFTDSNIVVDCAKGNSAVVNLGALGRVELVAGTKLTLRFSDGLISGDLQEGKAIVSSPQDVKVTFTTPDGQVVNGSCTQVSQTTECITPVAAQGFTQCVPVVAAAPVPVQIGRRGIGGWGVVAGLAGAAALTGGAIAIATEGDEDIFIPVAVSPVTP
jgi:hypothetical protein